MSLDETTKSVNEDKEEKRSKGTVLGHSNYGEAWGERKKL